MEIVKIKQYHWLVMAAGVFLLLMLQAGIIQAFAAPVFANFLLLFGIASVLDRPARRQVLIISLGLGLLADFASGLPDGVFVLAIPATLLLLHIVLTRLLPSHDILFATVFAALAAILAFYLIGFLVIFVFERLNLLPDFGFIPSIRHLWLELFLDLLFLYPIFLYYRWLTLLASKTN